MSYKEFFRTNLKFLEICSKFNVFPIEFTKHGTAKVRKNGARRIAYYCIVLNEILYTCYIGARFLQALMAEGTSFLQFALHVLLLSVCCISLSWSAYYFFWMESLTNIVLNELLVVMSNIQASKPRMQEWFTISIPFICMECSFIPIFAYVLDPDSLQTVYSGMSSFFQKTPYLMAATIMYEYLTFSFIICSFSYGFFVQLGILQSSQRELESGVRELRENSTVMLGRLKEHAEKCRRIQLRIAYFNKVYSWAIYMIKLECMFDAMYAVFLAMKIWETHPLLATLSGVFGIMEITTYCTMYSRGFEMPLLVEEYKELIMLHTAGLSRSEECMEVRKMVRSVSKVAIIVGQFHELQNSTTVEFVDFLVNNIVGLLVAYPGPIVL